MLHQLSWKSGVVGVLLAAIALAGCGQSGEPPAGQQAAPPAADAGARRDASGTPRTPPTLTLTDADEGRAVMLQRGQVVEVRLPADRAGGFTWVPAQHMLPVVSTDGVPQFEADEAGGPNAPGTEVWRFVGREAGHAQLQFEYRRLDDPDALPRQTIAFHFDVE